MRKLILLVFILIALGCVEQKYTLTTQTEVINSYRAKGIEGDGYIVTNNRTYIQNKVILIKTDMLENKVLNQTFNLINEQKYNALGDYLLVTDKDDPYYYFSSGLLEMYKHKYDSAIRNFDSNKNESIEFLCELLKVDCQYELSLINNNVDINNYIEKYQQIIDKYNPDQVYKKIINNRIRFVRYNI